MRTLVRLSNVESTINYKHAVLLHDAFLQFPLLIVHGVYVSAEIVQYSSNFTNDSSIDLMFCIVYLQNIKYLSSVFVSIWVGYEKTHHEIVLFYDAAGR